jgi:cytochrome b6-f complex subunit 7
MEMQSMTGEIFSTALVCFSLILVGLGGGFLLLKIQGGE